jgi:hypothetical protein
MVDKFFPPLRFQGCRAKCQIYQLCDRLEASVPCRDEIDISNTADELAAINENIHNDSEFCSISEILIVQFHRDLKL